MKNMKVKLVPAPKEIKGEDKVTEYKASIYTDVQEWNESVRVFVQYADKLNNISFMNNDDGIVLIKDASLKNGEYRIENTKIYAKDPDGINYALATVLQLIQKSDNGIYLPEVSIHDYPDSEYRGLMIDFARDWHDFKYLLNYVDMCYYYKVKVLQLHFTDTQSYTLPSKIYPKLSSVNRHYTFEEINTLVEYAKSRNIEICPEIDVPGHCDAFQSAYPEIFGTGGIIHMHNKSIKAMEDIFNELCSMFKYSKYIHLGGDEAAITKWTECNECMDYAGHVGIDTSNPDKAYISEQLLAHFITKLADVVFANNRTPIVWEGFNKKVNHMVSKDMLVMSWENYYQTTPELLEGGFRIINCSWSPMYVVTPVAYWSIKEVFDWNIYSWRPVHGGSPYIKTGLKIAPDSRVIGGQLLAWGDQIEKKYEVVEDGVKEEMKLLLERITGMSENTWNVNKIRDFDDFNECAEYNNNILKGILNL